MLENVIIYDGVKVYAFFPDGEMYVSPAGLEYKQSEDIAKGITSRKQQLTILYNWLGRAGIKVHNSHTGQPGYIDIELETVPRLNSHTNSITSFHSQFRLTNGGFEQDVKIIYHPREKYKSKGKLYAVRKRRWIVDPVNPHLPQKYLILSQLEQNDHGLVKKVVINQTPAQAIKRLIKRHVANFREQARDDLAEKLEKQLIWEIWFNEQGEIEVLKYNINEPGININLNALMGIY